MPYFKQLPLNSVLVVNDKVAFNNFFVVHVAKFASALHFGKMQCCITKKATPVLVSGRSNQVFEIFCKRIIGTE